MNASVFPGVLSGRGTSCEVACGLPLHILSLSHKNPPRRPCVPLLFALVCQVPSGHRNSGGDSVAASTSIVLRDKEARYEEPYVLPPPNQLRLAWPGLAAWGSILDARC